MGQFSFFRRSFFKTGELLQILKKLVKKRHTYVNTLSQNSCWNHVTIIQTGITCKEILCYMSGSACRWFVVKKAKIF